jgi:hypothetical protein
MNLQDGGNSSISGTPAFQWMKFTLAGYACQFSIQAANFTVTFASRNTSHLHYRLTTLAFFTADCCAWTFLPDEPPKLPPLPTISDPILISPTISTLPVSTASIFPDSTVTADEDFPTLLPSMSTCLLHRKLQQHFQQKHQWQLGTLLSVYVLTCLRLPHRLQRQLQR